MFWIGTGSILLIFYSFRAYLNNRERWQKRTISQQTSRLYFSLMQGGNILLIIASLLFLMLAVVCYVKGYEILFSSDYTYHMRINTNW